MVGENEKALFWIKKSVEINQEAHWSSEWLHVRILEAKIKGEEFITSDFLLGTNFGTGAKPISSLSADSLNSLMRSISYQLNERVTFIKGENKIVAQLLFDLGNLFFLSYNLNYPFNDPIETYELAKKYGFDDPIIDKRIQAASERKPNKYLHQAKKKVVEAVQMNQPLIYTLIFGIIITTLIVIVINSIKKK